MAVTHLIGLLLGVEEDWPGAFESLLGRLDPVIDVGGETHRFTTERVTIEPFNLRMVPRHALVIDRLAWWYDLPREWLKKVTLMNRVHLLNNPFTFEAMQKHAAYCAMIRLGLKIPETWMLPHKKPPDNPRFEGTAQRYLRYFDLDEVARQVGMPLFMKPFDGGAWVGVSRVEDTATLHRAYDESEQRLMHLQAAIDDYEVFARTLGIGAEAMVMRFRPERPMHERYAVDHNFLSPAVGEEVITILRTVNAFFRWELNSCETLVRGSDVHPIDYANATPDLAVTSLHYYFPWAIKTLVKWVIFCCVTGRLQTVDMDTQRYFAIADREDLSYAEKLRQYRKLAEEQLQVERYFEFCERHLRQVDEVCVEWVKSGDFDRLLVDTVRSTYPPHEHEQFTAHFRGLVHAWADDQHMVAA
jgi:hypothetical protein